MDWPADKVERRAIASLIPFARNARTHTPEQVAQLAASIREWGWTVPSLVDEDGGIIAGHARALAAQRLGIADVPVVVATGWSEAQKCAYVLADNKLAMNAGWDDELLKIELEGLKELDIDLELTGFSLDEIAALTADRSSGLTDPDEAPETPAIPVTRACAKENSYISFTRLRRALSTDHSITSFSLVEGHDGRSQNHHALPSSRLTSSRRRS